MKRWLWIGLAGVVLLSLAPLYSAEIFRGRVQRALEAALNRPVRVDGKTRVQILPVPAFVLERVTIAEDPSFSLEPFAYVNEMALQPALGALLSGRIEASRLRLTEPSVNLMRTAAGWNVRSLGGARLSPPDIEVRGGRINFKRGDEKSAFYLTNVLADLSAPSLRGDVDLFLEAEPARTDRGPQGFGKFSVRGQIGVRPGREAEIDFNVELEPSAIHAFNFFFGARSVDFAGRLSSKARVKGPLSAAKLEGWTEFEGVEPQGFLPFGAKSDRLTWAGTLDLIGQNFALDSAPRQTLRVRMRARELFQQPRGAFLIALEDVGVEKLIDLARQANTKLPPGAAAEGRFSAVVSYSWSARQAQEGGVPAQGMVWFDEATLRLPGNPAMDFGQASVVLDGPHWLLGPTQVRVGAQQNAVVEADWNSLNGALRFGVATAQLGMTEMRTGLGLLLRASQLPLLGAARGGSWQGNLLFRRTEDADPGTWSGRLSLRNSNIALDGFAEPLEVSTAQVRFDSNRVEVSSMRANWGGEEIEGRYAYYPGRNRAADFDLIVTETSLDRLAAALAPSLAVPRGLLERMRLRRVSPPDWLRDRWAKGRLAIKELVAPPGRFHSLDLRLEWHGTNLVAQRLRGAYDVDGEAGRLEIDGQLTLDLWKPSPAHVFRGKLLEWPSEDGPLNVEAVLEFPSLNPLPGVEAQATGQIWDNQASDAKASDLKLIWREGRLSAEIAGKKRSAAAGKLWPLQWEPESSRTPVP